MRDFVFPMFRANTMYEGEYLLGTSIARPLIAKRQIEIANQVGADAVAHGATGKGNDQVRFELGYYALKPDVKVIAPWREWELTSRETLMAYAEQARHPGRRGKRKASRRTRWTRTCCTSPMRAACWRTLGGAGGVMWRWTVAPEKAPNKADLHRTRLQERRHRRHRRQGDDPGHGAGHAQQVGGANGIGRADIVENRYVGMKSRGAYETPGGTIMLKAHRAIESLTLDREVAHLKDELMPRYAASSTTATGAARSAGCSRR